jgi:hypothetical protein
MSDTLIISNSTVFLDVCDTEDKVAATVGFRTGQGCTIQAVFRQPKTMFVEVKDVSGEVPDNPPFKIIHQSVTVVISVAPD